MVKVEGYRAPHGPNQCELCKRSAQYCPTHTESCNLFLGSIAAVDKVTDLNHIVHHMLQESGSAATEIAKAAKAAFEASQLIDSTERVKALREIRKELEADKNAILAANRADMEVLVFCFFLLLHALADTSPTLLQAAQK